MTDESPVLVSTEGHLGRLVLNRPRAINALTHEMVGLLTEALERWRDDDSIQTVLLTGAGDRGLCAGGDIVSLYHDARADRTQGPAFWRDEYLLDIAIAEFPKPVVAVMDGIVLGGGIGISAHASHRVVTERSLIGMPEVGIGFVPDVGGAMLLARAPGELGTHLALTAGSVDAGNTLAIGMADHYVASDRIDDLASALMSAQSIADVDSAIAQVASAAPEASLLAERAWIDTAYAGNDLGEIVTRLDAGLANTAQAKAAQRVRRNCPTSCAVALRALRNAADLDLRQTFDQDLRLAIRLQARPDFVEGVRAQVIDKDRNPQWDPPTIETLDLTAVDGCFASLGDAELGLHHDEREPA
ncbi:enoyl-CoA hydratase/isomerase family protein [Aeromicrobium sp. CF3.5]|uniref:enoyl-CoA hydratase/isomerase family protein n=1 Tax=Aeromicrobium sp. CF3.5 TaxID=3373078 RepID=UPI003EE658E9